MTLRIEGTFQQDLMTATSTVAPATVITGFHALSDLLRIQVLELLRSQELCVCELCEHVGVTHSKLSFHLKTLKETGLIRARQEGRWIYYSLNLPQFVLLEQYLAEYRRFSPLLQGRPCLTVALTTVITGFHALSEPLRIQVLEVLRTQELCVCELCEHLGVTQSKLSFHLKTFKEAGLVNAKAEGRWIYYSLNLSQFVLLEQYLAEYRRTSVMLPARPCPEVRLEK